MATALMRVIKQVNSLRNSKEDWFILPDAEDEDVDYMNFEVEIEALDNYFINPSGKSGECESPYKGGLFKIGLAIKDDFPSSPPKVRFITRIHHPGVAPDGAVCIPELEPGTWQPNQTLLDAFTIVRQYIGRPSSDMSGNADIAKEMREDLEGFEAKARKETEEWAAR